MGIKRLSAFLVVAVFALSSIALPLVANTDNAAAQSGTGLPDNPTTLISEAELQEIVQRVARNEQPWKSSYDSLLKKADGLLSFKALSVADNGGGNELRSGQKDTADYDAARKMSEAVYNLSMAYRLSGQDKYGKKALDLIDHWTVNDRTLMNPDMAATPSTGRLRVYITVPSMVYGADLIWSYDGWTTAQRTKFASWLRKLGQTAITTPVDSYVHPDGTKGSKNNKESFRQLMVAMAGGFLGDDNFLDNAFQSFKDGLPSDIGAPGSKYPGILLKERTRTVPKGGLFYSNYGLTGMTLVAEVAWQHGQDLYTYKTNNVSLKYAADTYVKYALNPNSWPYNNTKGVDGTTFSWYEYFYKRTGDPDYKRVIDKEKRPLSLNYAVMGNVTLGHARDNNDTSIPNDAGTIEPEPVPVTDGEDDSAPAPQPVIDIDPTIDPTANLTPISGNCEPLSDALSTSFGTASFEVDIPTAGQYTVWSRIWAPDNAVNSYWMNINNGFEENCKTIVGDNGSLIPARRWEWVDWKRVPSATPKEQPFVVDFREAGTFTVEIAGREGPLRLDRILFLSDDCQPEEFGDNCLVRGDLTAPVVSLDLASGSTVQGDLPVMPVIEDESRLKQVELTVDDVTVATRDGEPGEYSFNLDTTQFEDGDREVAVAATDENDNVSEVAVTVEFANAAPEQPSDDGDDGPIGGADDPADETPSDDDPQTSDDPDPVDSSDDDAPTPIAEETNNNLSSTLNCTSENAFICAQFSDSSEMKTLFRNPIPANAWTGNTGAAALVAPANQGSGNANLLISKQWVRGDQVIEVDALVDDGNKRFQDFSVIFNYRNTDTYYFASFNTENDNNTHGIFKVVNGDVEQIADFSSTIEQGRKYGIRIERQGTNIVVYRDDVVVGKVVDSSIKNGHVGVGSRNNAAVFDNFVAKKETVESSDSEQDIIGNPPTQVSNVWQAQSGKRRIKLKWLASSDDGQVEQYRVYRSENNGSSKLLGSTTDRVFYDLSIEENTTYTYTVTAIDNDSNESTPSKPLTIVKGENFSIYSFQRAMSDLLAVSAVETARRDD